MKKFGCILVIMASVLFGTSQLLAAPTLIAHWNFNEGEGNVLHDVSGNGHDGIINGSPAWLPVGQGLRFDGIDDYVEIPNTSSTKFNFTSGFVLDAWVRMDPANVNMDNVIVAQHKATIQAGYFLGVWQNQQFDFYLNGGVGPWPNRLLTTVPPSYNNATWYEVVGLYDGKTQYLSVLDAIGNTLYQGQQPMDYTSTVSTNITIGAVYSGIDGQMHLGGEAGHFMGDIRDLAIYSIPEPSTIALLGIGAVSLLAYAWRRRKTAA